MSDTRGAIELRRFSSVDAADEARPPLAGLFLEP
jgi:hypothetical protein